MIERDKSILRNVFVDDDFGEALKLAMLEFFPELKAKDIDTGVDRMRDKMLGVKLETKQKAIH